MAIIANIQIPEGMATLSDLASVSGVVVAQIPSDYITNAQLTTTSGDVVGQIPVNYVTITQLLTSSGNIVAQIPTDYITPEELSTTSGNIVLQIPVEYVTPSELTTASGDIVNQIPADYISDIEMTTISGDIVNQIPTDYITPEELSTTSGNIVLQIPVEYITPSELTTASGDIVDQIPVDYITLANLTTTSGDIVDQIGSGPGLPESSAARQLLVSDRAGGWLATTSGIFTASSGTFTEGLTVGTGTVYLSGEGLFFSDGTHLHSASIESATLWSQLINNPDYADRYEFTFNTNELDQSESLAIYDTEGKYYWRGDSSGTFQLELTPDDYSRGDMKASIYRWVRDATVSGHFEDVSNTPLTLGVGNDCPLVTSGMQVEWGGGSAYITQILGDGESTGEVVLSSDPGSTKIVEGVYGTKVEDGQIKLTGYYVGPSVHTQSTSEGEPPPAPFEPNKMPRMAIVGDTLCVAGGREQGSTSYHGESHSLNLSTMEWGSSENVTERINQIMVEYNGYIYMHGGYYYDNGDYYLRDMRKYDPVADSWSFIGNYEYLAEHAAAVDGNYMYIYGGRNSTSSYLDTLYRFNLSTEQWEGPLSTTNNTSRAIYPRRGHAIVIYNNYLYVFGGDLSGSSHSKAEVFRLNLSTMEWEAGFNEFAFPRAPGGGFADFVETFVYGKYAYCLIGDGTGKSVFRYDLECMVWSDELADLYTLTSSHSIMAGPYGGKMWIYETDGTLKYMTLPDEVSPKYPQIVMSDVIDTSQWTELNSLSFTTSGSRDWLYHIFSFDGGQTFRHYFAGFFPELIQFSAGNWQYRNIETEWEWENSPINSANAALSLAMYDYNNYNSYTTPMENVVGVGWEGWMGFDPGTTTSAIIATAFLPVSPAALGKSTFSYDRSLSDIVLVTPEKELSKVDPDKGYVVIEVQPVGDSSLALDDDVKIWISTDDGQNYTQVSGLMQVYTDSSRFYIQGFVEGLPVWNDNSARVRITTHNSVNLIFHRMAFGLHRYSTDIFLHGSDVVWQGLSGSEIEHNLGTTSHNLTVTPVDANPGGWWVTKGVQSDTAYSDTLSGTGSFDWMIRV